MSFRSRTLLAIAGVVATTSLTHAADETSNAALLKRLDELDQQVKVLARKAEIAGEEAAAKAKTAVSAKADDGGFSFGNSDKDNPFSLKIGVLAQLDGRFWINDGKSQATSREQSNTFLFRRAQPTIDAQLGKYVRTRWQASFDAAGAFNPLEYWLEFKPVDELAVTAGRFKTIGVEYINSTAGLAFNERGLTTGLVPAYDVGLQVGGKVGDLGTWAIGVVNGSADGATRATDSDDDKDVFARVAFTPFKAGEEDLLKGLAIHLGATKGYDSASGGLTAGYRSVSQATIFSYEATAVASGDRFRLAPAIEWYYGPFGLLAEYVSSSQEISRGTRTDVEIENTAWQLVLSYVLTGENKAAGGLRPKQPFNASGDGWGAWEVVARVGELEIDDKAFDPVAGDRFANLTTQISKASSASLGVNWYLTRNLKWQLSGDYTRFEGGGGGTYADPIDRESERLIVTRFQVNY